MTLLACVFANHAVAEKPSTPAEFSSIVTGKSFDFSVGGTTYGREYYLPGNRVIWDDTSGRTCRQGKWYAQNREICFVYEDEPQTPKCWHFFEGTGGVHGLLFTNNDSDMRRYSMIESNGPMMCTDPDMAV
ncbi:MAG: hypothetical protein AAF386_07615 [Pseudomonadota bacterium]